MRILFITGLTSFGVGGARAETVRLLRGVAGAGHTVGLCADRLPDGAPPDTRHFSIAYPFRRTVAAQLRRAVNEFDPHVVHAVGGGIRFLRAAESVLNRVSWALTIHNVPPAERIVPLFFNQDRLHNFARNMLCAPSIFSWRRFLRNNSASVAICHSGRVDREIRSAGYRRHIEVISLGSEEPQPHRLQPLSPSHNHPINAGPRIVSIGGLAPHKGQLDLIFAIRDVMEVCPDLKCDIIGSHRSKRYRQHLLKTIHQLNLDKHVRLTGATSETAKAEALSQADVYVQPSREEGFCLAFLEAATRVPKMVGVDTGAIDAVASRHPAAIVVAPGDRRALAAAIESAIKRPVPSPAELENGRAALRAEFSWAEHLRRHLALYAHLQAAGADHSSSDGTR